MTTNKRYKTYEHIRKMPNYTAVHEELDAFFGGLATEQVDWFREVFSKVIGARILSEGYVDCSLYIRYEQPKLVNTKLLKQMGSVVQELYRTRKSGEDNSLAVVFADFWGNGKRRASRLARKKARRFCIGFLQDILQKWPTGRRYYWFWLNFFARKKAISSGDIWPRFFMIKRYVL